jgi:hypothetical protein
MLYKNGALFFESKGANMQKAHPFQDSKGLDGIKVLIMPKNFGGQLDGSSILTRAKQTTTQY